MNSIKIIKRIAYGIIVILLLASFKALSIYRKAFKPNFFADNKNKTEIFIRTGSDFEEVYATLQKTNIIRDTASFAWTAKKKNYPNHIHPGRYEIKNRMSNNDVINILRSGQQTPLDVSFNNQRTLKDLAKRVSQQLEPDEKDFYRAFTDTAIINKYSFSKETFKCMFIPNTYEIWWNTSPERFIARMNAEYKNFWKGKREKQAALIGLNHEEVITLASIVQQETRNEKEKPIIAGVYMNRLKRGIKLDADPTLIFAIGDYNKKRVLNKDKKVNSPYNTYMNAGLPPGPICIPDISTIDAVLNYEKHNYIFFCLKPDFSGHNFAKNLKEHNRNAALYHKELNRRRIYK